MRMLISTFVTVQCITHHSRTGVDDMQAGGGRLAKVTAGWQAGRISNLDYLLYCNLAAGRSFNDLTQVPCALVQPELLTLDELLIRGL